MNALKAQGVAGSICPTTSRSADKEVDGKPNPYWGYRPATKALGDRLKTAFAYP